MTVRVLVFKRNELNELGKIKSGVYTCTRPIRNPNVRSEWEYLGCEDDSFLFKTIRFPWRPNVIRFPYKKVFFNWTLGAKVNIASVSVIRDEKEKFYRWKMELEIEVMEPEFEF